MGLALLLAGLGGGAGGAADCDGEGVVGAGRGGGRGEGGAGRAAGPAFGRSCSSRAGGKVRGLCRRPSQASSQPGGAPPAERPIPFCGGGQAAGRGAAHPHTRYCVVKRGTARYCAGTAVRRTRSARTSLSSRTRRAASPPPATTSSSRCEKGAGGQWLLCCAVLCAPVGGWMAWEGPGWVEKHGGAAARDYIFFSVQMNAASSLLPFVVEKALGVGWRSACAPGSCWARLALGVEQRRCLRGSRSRAAPSSLGRSPPARLYKRSPPPCLPLPPGLRHLLDGLLGHAGLPQGQRCAG